MKLSLFGLVELLHLVIFMLTNTPIIGSDHAPILLNMIHYSHQIMYSDFKFEAKWLLNNEFFELVKHVWSLFVKYSHAYQLTMKFKCYRVLLKNWKKQEVNNPDYI